jgi:16S rRNA (adenine1518-N6/adenine1519-N6)-dimethyltransferase
MGSIDSDKPIDSTRPKKRLSQNFLIDRNVAAKIVRIADLKPGDPVIEVGPGRGILTGPIIEAGTELICIEIDTGLAKSIEVNFSKAKNFRVINTDALKFSFIELSNETARKYKLISNLPYNISGPMLAKLIDERAAFSMMVLMFQKEVAQRITAKPGTKAYGSLSVLAQTYMDVYREFDIAPHLFKPVPKVESTVLSFNVLEAPRIEIRNEASFKSVVKCAFAQRRKTLFNSLKSVCPDRERVSEALEASSIDPGRRGETLSIEEFAKLTDALDGATQI